jgi:hypothetical protein
MFAFLVALGLDPDTARLRSHLDHDNLTRAGRIARYLSRADFQQHRESLLELYADHGLLGSEISVVVDSLYTVADVLGPFDNGAANDLMVSGMEEAYFTDLARLVLHRQADGGELSLGWHGRIGALYFRVLEGRDRWRALVEPAQVGDVYGLALFHAVDAVDLYHDAWTRIGIDAVEGDPRTAGPFPPPAAAFRIPGRAV